MMALSIRRNPQVIQEITAATYTVDNGDWGSLITNRGGGALTVTLPEPANAPTGAWVEFFLVVAGDFVIGTAGGDAMVLHNNAAADSLTTGQASEEIGNGFRVVNDGTGWLVYRFPGNEAVTTTVTDA